MRRYAGRVTLAISALFISNYKKLKVDQTDNTNLLQFALKSQVDKHAVFIHENGFMSDAPFGYNGLSKDLVEDKAKLQHHFESEFAKRDTPFGLIDLWKENPLKL